MNKIERIPAARAVVATFHRLDQACDLLQKRNHESALNSFNTNCDTYELMDRMIERAYQIQQLNNLKVKTLQIFDAMPQRAYTAIKLHFLCQMSPQDVATEMGVSRATVFRLLQQGIAWLADELDLNKVNYVEIIREHDWMLKEYERQRWLMKSDSLAS